MKKISLLIAVLLLAACQPKKSPVRASYVNGVTTSGLVGGISCNTGQVGTTEGVINDSGVQYEQGDATGTFQDRVKAFLTASVLPTDVGTIQGVRFVGGIKLDAAGNVISGQSKVIVGVYDNHPSQTPIRITFDGTAGSATLSGQFDPKTGAGTLTMRDSYGEIRMNGSVNAQNFSGTVRYTNSQTVVANSAATKGPLGAFSIPRCAFFQ